MKEFKFWDPDSEDERMALLVDYQRVWTPLDERTKAFLMRQPYLQDPRGSLHYPPPMPSPEDWAEALYLLQSVSGWLRTKQGTVVRMQSLLLETQNRLRELQRRAKQTP